MARLILLDAGVVGLLCASPNLPNVQGCRLWTRKQDQAGAKFFLSDLTFFEVERGLILVGAHAKLARLDDLAAAMVPLGVSRPAWRKAAEFWAFLQRAGLPTAHKDALDGDAILAGVAATIGGAGDEVLVATTNIRHLGRFPGVEAREWTQIT